VTERRLKFWGWGYADDLLSAEDQRWLEAAWARRFGVDGFEATPPPREDEIVLRKPRIEPPASLRTVCTTEHYERLLHCYGKSFPDSARMFARDFSNPPDVVAYPRGEQDVVDLLHWCGEVDAAVIPFGGGTSVVGGVEPPHADRPVVTIDLKRMDRLLEVDPVSLCARFQAGVLGPSLERQLKPHGLTLRHFPQSFEFSTLGGWIVTRAGGHFATVYTHIDDLVESVRVVTPGGIVETRRLPASGAGPSPDRLFIGSEGTLGIVTEAWVRVRPRPAFRSATTVRFPDLYAAAGAIRRIAQAGLYPANCRVLDNEEAAITEAGDGRHAVLVLTFESADHPLDAWMKRALEICADSGGQPDAAALERENSHRSGAAGQWRDRFLRGPWFRENLTARGIIRETFETAITWERFEALHTTVLAAARDAVRRATGREGSVTCRFTHVYPDGPAPYFTFHGLGRKDALLEQFWEIKRAASDALIAAGGTITHHHAVGRDHRPWYDRQRPELFAAVLRSAKRTLDPKGLLNPGVLFDTQ
jgi:alkyldihydroxyacetonephosphate synthase